MRSSAARCRMPPLSCEGYAFWKPSSPKSANSASARARASFLRTPCASRPSAVLSSTVRHGNNRSFCGM